MKKKRLFGLLLLAPLGLLAGCGGTATLSFSPNWFQNNRVENMTGKSERLEYEVTFQSSSLEGLNVNYDVGSYVTTLSSEDLDVALSDGTVQKMQVYRFETEFHISGKYTFDGTDGEPFQDSMTSTVWFMSATNGLLPVKSEKEVHATVPDGTDGLWYSTYDFTYQVTYVIPADPSERTSVEKAHFLLDVTAPESRKETKEDDIDLDYDETFLDNEEITIALRGLNLTSASSAIPFVTIDPQTRQAVKVNLSMEQQTVNLPFTYNGQTVDGNISAVQVTCSYNSAQPGPPRRFLYASRTDEGSEKYRSVLLRFESEVMYSLGTMTYTLKNAQFND